MENLIEVSQRLLRELVPTYHRRFYDEFRMETRLVGVIGARGVGKTTFLLHYLRTQYGNSEKALYISADNLYFAQHTLLEVIDQFVKQYAGEIICIDEIHKYKNWNQELKNIYDSYPHLMIIFSGSSSIDLIKGEYDLSRRAFLKTLYGFSFREYLEIHEKKQYPLLSFKDIITHHQSITRDLAETPKLLGYMRDYMQEGYYPTRLQDIETKRAFYQSIRNVIDKTIYEDISSFYSLNTQNLDTLKKIIYFFATTQPGSVNVNTIANSIGKDYATIATYIQYLRDSGILRFLLKNKSGHALIRDTEKVYLDNPNMLFALCDELGKAPLVGVLRELFIVSALENADYHVYYTHSGDIECNNVIFEIGGKSKTQKQLNHTNEGFIIKDDILIGDIKSIPLYLFGFLS